MIKILQPGLHTSIQDRGRFGFSKYAIPQSGAMDTYAAKFANLLLQNNENANVLEITLIGPKLEFLLDCDLALSGLGAKIKLNSTEISINKVFTARKGDVLHIQQITKGNYAYLACKGGFKSQEYFKSSSFYPLITSKSKLHQDDVLEASKTKQIDFSTYETHSMMRFQEDLYNHDAIEVFEGPEFYLLNKQQQKKLFEIDFHLSKNYNRMAFQLEESFQNNLESIITSTVTPGTVQLTPDGKLIILMKDAQTTGGYPRILQLSKKAIIKLSQKRQNESLQFSKLHFNETL